MIHPTLTLACSILFMIHHAHSQPGGMGQGMPGQGNMGMPPMGGMGGMGEFILKHFTFTVFFLIC